MSQKQNPSDDFSLVFEVRVEGMNCRGLLVKFFAGVVALLAWVAQRAGLLLTGVF